MGLWNWSTTAANNATADPSINWQEGQAPSTVNDSARAMMAAIATWYQAPEWLNYGMTPTYVSATQFTVAGNQAGVFSGGRRVKATVTSGVIYGTILTSVYTSLTTVTVTWDSASLDSGLSEVDVHIINPALHPNFSLQTLTLDEPGNGIGTLTIYAAGDANGANIRMTGNGATTPNKFIRVSNGSLQVNNSGYTSTIFSLDDPGNLTVSGNITSNSDERLKFDWKPMQSDFLESLAALLRGTYTRTDTGKRQLGVGAQSLRRFMAEAVQEDADGVLSVAYGQAALVACGELAAEVIRLRSLLEPIK